jgi:hypothetical protein
VPIICCYYFTAGLDFVDINDQEVSINFSPFPFQFTLLEDDLAEPQETFNLVLSPTNAGGVSIAPGLGTATINIEDNDRKQESSY